MFDRLRLSKMWIRTIICPILALTACSSASTYPWSLTNKVIPEFQIISTENPIKDEYMVTYTVKAATAVHASRDDIKLMSEKIIEGLPNHNMAIICFVTNPGESEDWTVARTWWGPEHAGQGILPFAGDYSQNILKIAIKGEALPGVTIRDN